MPGPVSDTEVMARLTPTPDSEVALRKMIPLGDYGEKREIADLAIFLSSDSAKYITAAIFDCDGGSSMTIRGLIDPTS